MAAAVAPLCFGTEALQHIGKLTSVHDINRLLNETAAKERAIDDELEQLLNQRSQLGRSVSSLNASTSQVEPAGVCYLVTGTSAVLFSGFDEQCSSLPSAH